MTTIFLLTWLGQSFTGVREYNQDQVSHGQQAIAWSSYVRNADFWERSFQNWQSEFLAVGIMAIFSVYLRQRGSPESKRLDAPHDKTSPTY